MLQMLWSQHPDFIKIIWTSKNQEVRGSMNTNVLIFLRRGLLLDTLCLQDAMTSFSSPSLANHKGNYLPRIKIARHKRREIRIQAYMRTHGPHSSSGSSALTWLSDPTLLRKSLSCLRSLPSGFRKTNTQKTTTTTKTTFFNLKKERKKTNLHSPCHPKHLSIPPHTHTRTHLSLSLEVHCLSLSPGLPASPHCQPRDVYRA